MESPPSMSYELLGQGCAMERRTAAEGMSVMVSAAAEGFLGDSRVFVNEEIAVDRVRTRSLSVLL